ncbi:MAG: lipopolysaccharide biosynthesis protein, partial [Salibacteraceae bacterium]
TAIYGLPSILGRFLNYLLFPLYTAQFIPAEYGVVNEVYAYVAFIAVILPWGMETAFFRFSNKKDYTPNEVFRTSLFFVFLSSIIFMMAITFLTDGFANAMGYANNPEYIIWMGLTIGFDALAVIPLAQLRNEEKALKFALVNFMSIGTNIVLNLFFIWYCMDVFRDGGNAITDFAFNPEFGVGYIFLANMIQALVKFLLVSPAYQKLSFRINGSLLKELLIYSSPLVLAGFAGIINETLDRTLIRRILEPTIGESAALTKVGIYGAVYKLAILITLFTQAFRYAAEPFFFSQDKEGNSRKVYADVLKWYTVIVTVLFLFVMLYIDVFKQLIRNEAYWEGLTIVPILLFANIFLGWIYNLSVWYKLTHKTIYGAILAVIGAVITVSLNLYLIPKMGYAGAAWTTFASYGVMAVISYLLGQRFFKIPYELPKIIGYCIVSVLLWYGSTLVDWNSDLTKYTGNTALMLFFFVFIFLGERKDLNRFIK